jgi:hypothetical protein
MGDLSLLTILERAEQVSPFSKKLTLSPGRLYIAKILPQLLCSPSKEFFQRI